MTLAGTRRILMASKKKGNALNPLATPASVTLSGGNLIATATGSSGPLNWTTSTVGHATGKYYFEVTPLVVVNSLGPILVNSAASPSQAPYQSVNGMLCYESGQVFTNNAQVATATAFGTNDVVRIAVDLTADFVWFAVNGGIWNNSAPNNPATGVGGINVAAISSGGTGIVYAGIFVSAFNDSMKINFGPTFGFAPPSGYVAF